MSVARVHRRWILAALVASALGACQSPAEPARDVVPGEYLVALKDHVQDVDGLARELSARVGGTVLSVWPSLKGFAIRLREPARIQVARLRAHPAVRYVEPNRIGRPDSDGP